jgi:predicted ribosome quality control (RQC) complex YloA/Tae2 family protein
MSRKEITSNVFYYLCKELEKELCLGYINNIQNIDYDTIKIKIHRKRTKQLIVRKEILYISNYDLKVMTKSTEFVRFLKKKLYNQRIQEIKQHNNNKVVYFTLDDYFLIFEFFSNSNIILTNKEFVVVSAKRYERWKDRNIIRHEKYSFPKCGVVFDIKEDLNLKDTKEIIKYFVNNYNIAPFYIKDILKDSKDIGKDIKKLFEFKSVDVIDNNNLFVVKESKENKDISEVFDKLFVNDYLENKDENQQQTKKQTKIKLVLEKQDEKLKDFEEKIKVLKKEAETIYLHFNIIDEINKQINAAIAKKIPKKEIQETINKFFKSKDSNLKIKEIDLKNKKYTLHIKQKDS